MVSKAPLQSEKITGPEVSKKAPVLSEKAQSCFSKRPARTDDAWHIPLGQEEVTEGRAAGDGTQGDLLIITCFPDTEGQAQVTFCCPNRKDSRAFFYTNLH